MSDTPKSPHSARSRAPLDDVGITWWELYGNADTKPTTDDLEDKRRSNNDKVHGKTAATKTKVDKSTNTVKKLKSDTYKNVVGKTVDSREIRERVLKKWREEQAKIRYEAARKALIDSLKLKFNSQSNVTTKPSNENKMSKTIVTYGKYDKTTEKILNQNTYDALAQTKLNLESQKDKTQHSKALATSLQASCHAKSIEESGHKIRPPCENSLTLHRDNVQNPSPNHSLSSAFSRQSKTSSMSSLHKGDNSVGIVRSSSEGACHARSLLEPGCTVAQRRWKPVRGGVADEEVRDWLAREDGMPVRFYSSLLCLRI